LVIGSEFNVLTVVSNVDATQIGVLTVAYSVIGRSPSLGNENLGVWASLRKCQQLAQYLVKESHSLVDSILVALPRCECYQSFHK
jgi:hypothetical protein